MAGATSERDKIIKQLYVKEHEILVSLFREKEQKKRKKDYFDISNCAQMSVVKRKFATYTSKS